MPKKSLRRFSKAAKKLRPLSQKKRKPRTNPLWKMEDGVTYSMLSKFMGCRQRFHMSKIEGWKSKKFSIPLEFGNLFHLLIEAQDRGLEMNRLRQLCNNYITKKITTAEPGKFNERDIRDMNILAGLVFVTFENYVSFWDQNASITFSHQGVDQLIHEKDFDWIAKERPFDCQYTMCTGDKIRIRGKKDGVFNMSKKFPRRVILETKTKGTINPKDITEGLHKDMQTGFYAVADEIEYGSLADGVLYNVIRRSQARPRVKETVDQFVGRVGDDIAKRPDYYFHRWYRPFDKFEHNEFKLRTLDPQLFQLKKWWDSIKGNPMRPFETDCSVCWGDHIFAVENNTLQFEECTFCKGKGRVPNLHHFERPFGVYDSMAHGHGEFFEILCNNNYNDYEQEEYIFPELEIENEVDIYLAL